MDESNSIRNMDDYCDKGYLIIENALSQRIVDDLCN